MERQMENTWSLDFSRDYKDDVHKALGFRGLGV